MAPRARPNKVFKAPVESTSEPSQAHLPCDINPDCDSSDAMTLYDDGHKHCFSCGKTWQATAKDGPKVERDEELMAAPSLASGDLNGFLSTTDHHALPSRKITQATTRHWDYKVRVKDGHPEHVAVYRNTSGSICAVKIRTDDKRFFWVGDNKKLPLYGQWLWGQGGRQVVVTEGEIDALSVSQMFGNKWPVVSVPNGADNAKKDVTRNLEWLNTFDKVIFAFDMDEPGRKAAEECARVLPPGKAFIAHLPEKDPNDCLLAGKSEELNRCIWNAKAYRPDGIVDLFDMVDEILNPPLSGLPWPWPFLTEWTYGRRYGEVYTFGAGTGIGKSDLVNQVIAYTIQETADKCAVFSWEAGPQQTGKSLAGKIAHRRFHIPDPKHENWTQAELEDTLRNKIGRGRVFLNNAFGVADWELVKERIRFLAHSEGIKHVVLDPLTALVAGDDREERVALEAIMAEVAGIAQELQICFYLVSHLATPEGTPHEEGGRVTIRHFKGSRSIGQWSFFMFGLERDQQADGDAEDKATIFRCLKDRFTGNATGKTVKLFYDVISGTLDPENTGVLEQMETVDALTLQAAEELADGKS